MAARLLVAQLALHGRREHGMPIHDRDIRQQLANPCLTHALIEQRLGGVRLREVESARFADFLRGEGLRVEQPPADLHRRHDDES